MLTPDNVLSLKMQPCSQCHRTEETSKHNGQVPQAPVKVLPDLTIHATGAIKQVIITKMNVQPLTRSAINVTALAILDQHVSASQVQGMYHQVELMP